MQRSLLILAALLVVAGLSGCLRAPVVPPQAFVYTHFKAPLETHYTGDDLGTRKGTAKTHCFRFYVDFAWADSAIKAAAKDGDITVVKGADYEYMNILGIYQEFTVYAYGD